MVTNDIERLAPGQGCRAVLLTVKGKMIAELAVYHCGDDGFLLEMEGNTSQEVLATMERHLIMDDVVIRPAGDGMDQLGVYGEGAAAALEAAIPGLDVASLPPYFHKVASGIRVARTPELGVAGFHLFASPDALGELQGRLRAAGAEELPEEEAEVLRIEAGRPRYGLDMDQERLPIEANLDDAVSFTKGCYLGQEVIARVTARGHVNRRLMGLRFPGSSAPPPRGTPLWHESRPGKAGTVMSGVCSPRFGPIALGYVHRTLWQPGTELRVCGPQGEPEAEAIVCALPFSESTSQGS